MCAQSVIAQIAREPEARVCFHGVEPLLLQFVSVNFCREADAASFLPHVNQDAVSFVRDLAQRGVQLIPAIAAPRTEDVASETFAVNADQRRAVLRDLAFDQREMMRAVELRSVKMQIEIAVIGRQFHHLFRFDKFLRQTPMRDQALDRADPQPMFLPELHQFWEARHRPVVVQNFAENSGRLQTGHSRVIDRGFGVTGAPQDAAILRAQRKDVTGLD